MNNDSKTTSWLFILTILLVYPLPQLAIDIYLPSWTAMTHSIQAATESLLQLSLTIYILFLGLTQLFYGPCSDRYGRKPILLIGSFIFLVSSIAAMFVTSINELLICRALQGIGMGCGFTVASAILGDIFTGKRLAQMTSYSAMLYSFTVIFAPVIGGYLQHYIGWQANFFVMTSYAFILLVFLYLFVSETNKQPDKTAFTPKKIFKNYLSLLSNFRFIVSVSCLTLAFGFMIVFNIVGPFMLQSILHVTAVAYGQLLLLVGLSYLIGVSINSRLLKKFKPSTLILLGIVMLFIASFGLLISSAFNWFSSASIILFTSLSIFATGFIFPNCFAQALEIFPGQGAASAFIASTGLIGTSLISIIVTHLHVIHEYTLSYIYITLTILCALSYFSLKIAKP